MWRLRMDFRFSYFTYTCTNNPYNYNFKIKRKPSPLNMRIHIVTANFHGLKKKPLELFSSEHEVSIANYTDENTPSRHLAMHPRLKSKIPKMLEWRNVEADWYIWLDSSFTVTSKDLISDVLRAAGENPLCFYKHHQRNSIKEECDFMSASIKNWSLYLSSRYNGEPYKEQVAHYLNDETFKDDCLFACGFFAYHRSMAGLMQDWFLENVCWSLHDQLSLPYVLKKHNAKYSLFSEGIIIDNPYVKHNFAVNKSALQKLSYKLKNLYLSLKSLTTR